MAMPMCPQYQSDHGLCRKFCLVSGLWRFLRFCRKVRFLGQNPKIECREFNDLQTARLSKKQLCDRTLMLPSSTTTHENRIYKATLSAAASLARAVWDPPLLYRWVGRLRAPYQPRAAGCV